MNISDNLLSITLFSLVGLFAIFYKLNHHYYKNQKFQQMIEIITAVSTLFLTLSVIYQVITYKVQRGEDLLKIYTNFSKDYLDSIINLFIAHPEMNYYYKELFDIEKMDTQSAQRNLDLENEINASVLAKTVEQIGLLELTTDLGSNVFKNATYKILNTFFKSESFKNYYINYYKDHLANQTLKDYIQTNFGF
jgi:hypothetical protein